MVAKTSTRKKKLSIAVTNATRKHTKASPRTPKVASTKSLRAQKLARINAASKRETRRRFDTLQREAEIADNKKAENLALAAFKAAETRRGNAQASPKAQRQSKEIYREAAEKAAETRSFNRYDGEDAPKRG